MKVTKKAINKALPSIRYFNKWYVPLGFIGLMPKNVSTLPSVIFRVDKHGDVIERDYAMWETQEPEDCHMKGVCVDASDVIENWMHERISREEVVDEIQQLFAEWEEEESFRRKLKNL